MEAEHNNNGGGMQQQQIEHWGSTNTKKSHAHSLQKSWNFSL